MPSAHFAFGRAVPRRAFLRGVGVSLALPLLEAMCPAFAAAAPTPKRRLVAICTTLGIHPDNLLPTGTGRDYQPTLYSQVLEPLRDRFTLFSGLSHPEVDGGHASEASYLTAAAHPGASGFRNSISLDQYALEKLNPDTRFSSLSLSSNGSYSLSWTSGGVNIPADDRPSKIFARLFLDGTAADVEQQIRRLKDGQSIMDRVAAEAKSFQRQLGSTDREKLDQYFTSVRELEQRLLRGEHWARRPKPTVAMQPPVDVTNHADLVGRARPLFDLIHLALQTDSTRFVTLLLQGFNQVPLIPGVSQDWHNLSHHGKDPSKISELAIIEKAEFAELHSFLEKLQSTQEEGQSLFDRTMVLYGSNLGNSSSHDTRNLPMLLAGGGFKHGQHLAFDKTNNTPLANLYLSMLQQLGVETNSFASGKATLAGLAAA